MACAPRLSVLLPTGDDRRGFGSGAIGIQSSIPLSVVISRHFVVHADLGVTYTPAARNTRGDRADTTSYLMAGSVVWLARPAFNMLLESVWEAGESVAGARRRDRFHSLTLSPGARWAINFDSGLQIVPGIALPIGVGPSAGQRGVFLYLSFEHAFTKNAVGPGRSAAP